MLCFKVRSSIIIYVRNTEGGPFLMLHFEVRPFIKHVRNTEGGSFPMLRFKVNPFIRSQKYRGRTIFYATFQGPPFYKIC